MQLPLYEVQPLVNGVRAHCAGVRVEVQAHELAAHLFDRTSNPAPHITVPSWVRTCICQKQKLSLVALLGSMSATVFRTNDSALARLGMSV